MKPSIEQEIARLHRRKIKLEKLLRLRSEVAELELKFNNISTDGAFVFNAIAVIVARHAGYDPDSLWRKTRTQRLADARFLVWYFAREYSGTPFSQLGEMSGGRDHGTVLYGAQSVVNRMSTDAQFALTVETLRAEVLASLQGKTLQAEPT